MCIRRWIPQWMCWDILCARIGIFIWCHFNFPAAFSFYGRNENESNGKKGSIQRCSPSSSRNNNNSNSYSNNSSNCSSLSAIFGLAAVLPLGLCWRAMRLLFAAFMYVCVCVCQLDTVQRIVQSPLQITCGSVKQKRWQLCACPRPTAGAERWCPKWRNRPQADGLNSRLYSLLVTRHTILYTHCSEVVTYCSLLYTRYLKFATLSSLLYIRNSKLYIR